MASSAKSKVQQKKKHLSVLIGDIILIILNAAVVLPAFITYAITFKPELMPLGNSSSYYFVHYLTVFYSVVPLICMMNIIVLYINLNRHSAVKVNKIYASIGIVISLLPIIVSISAYIQRYT